MNINISDETRICGAPDAWEWQTRRKDKKSDTGYSWVPRRYYTSLKTLIRSELQRDIRCAPADTLADAIDGVQQAVSRWSSALDPKISVGIDDEGDEA